MLVILASPIVLFSFYFTMLRGFAQRKTCMICIFLFFSHRPRRSMLSRPMPVPTIIVPRNPRFILEYVFAPYVGFRGACTVCGFCREALVAASLRYRPMTGDLPLDGNPVGYILGYVLPWPPSSPDAGKGSRPVRRYVCCPRPRGRMVFGLLI